MKSVWVLTCIGLASCGSPGPSGSDIEQMIQDSADDTHQVISKLEKRVDDLEEGSARLRSEIDNLRSEVEQRENERKKEEALRMLYQR